MTNTLVIDVMSRIPVYEQIIQQVEDMVLKGIMKPGDKMPSVRQLSTELAINPNTIQKAYALLDSRELIVSVPGKGSFISEKAVKVIENSSKSKLAQVRDIVTQLAYAGVSRDEVISIIEEVYKKI